MKTTILTSIVLMALALGTCQPTFASTGNNSKVSIHSPVTTKINKIELRGNVKLYVSNGAADLVKTYGDNYSGELLPDQNGVLRITSYEGQQLVVWVTANNLDELEVYDNAEVRSFGQLSGIELNIKLHDNASAWLNVDAYQANITLNDHAKAAFAGNIENIDIKCDSESFADTTSLTWVHLTKQATFSAIASNDL